MDPGSQARIGHGEWMLCNGLKVSMFVPCGKLLLLVVLHRKGYGLLA